MLEQPPAQTSRRRERAWKLPGLVLAALLLTSQSKPAPDVPGQERADYHAWLARDPAARAQLLAFKQFLEMEELGEVVPTWQLVRTASMWRECNGPRFEVAPFVEWQNVAETLQFVKNHVEPVIGDVEVMSGYRNAELNACSGGAKESAHRRFFALDLVPIEPVSRDGMIRSLCAIHRFRGADYETGLGFYTGLRFHVDSKGFRKWGSNGRSATSPCNGANLVRSGPLVSPDMLKPIRR